MLHSIKNIFHLIIIFQCLFFTIYLLTHKGKKRWSNLFLMGFLLSIMITQLGGVLSHFEELRSLVVANAPHVFFIEFPFRFLYIPFLFLYLLSLTTKKFSFGKVDLLHFVPFILFVFLAVLKGISTTADALRDLLLADSPFNAIEIEIIIFSNYLQFFCYAVASLLVLKNYRKRIKNVFSTIENINLSWLNFVVFGFIGWKSLRFIEYVLWLLTQSSFVMYLYIAAEIMFLLFVSLMFLWGLRQPVILTGLEENQNRRKYEKTSLSEEARDTLKNKLLHHMESQKPYLDSTLSLNDLAKNLSSPPHHLSQVINTCFNQNFFDFINTYRIKECQQLLSDKTHENKTVLEILYETGFNSKSVFNSAFKKYTGMTPTQFRKLQNS